MILLSFPLAPWREASGRAAGRAAATRLRAPPRALLAAILALGSHLPPGARHAASCGRGGAARLRDKGRDAGNLGPGSEAQKPALQPGQLRPGPPPSFSASTSERKGQGGLRPGAWGHCTLLKAPKPPRAVPRRKGSTGLSRMDPCPNRTTRDGSRPVSTGSAPTVSWAGGGGAGRSSASAAGSWAGKHGLRGGRGDTLPTQRWGPAGPAFLHKGLCGSHALKSVPALDSHWGAHDTPAPDSLLSGLPGGGDNPRPQDRQEEGPRPRLLAAQLLSGRMGLIRTTS